MRFDSLRALLVVSITAVIGGTGITGLGETVTASDACDWSGVAWIGDGKRQPSERRGILRRRPGTAIPQEFRDRTKRSSRHCCTLRGLGSMRHN